MAVSFTHRYKYTALVGVGTYKFRHWGLTRQRLAAPGELSANGTVVSWSGVANATGYEVFADGTVIGTVSTASIDLTSFPAWTSLSPGAHTITVTAKADGYADSEPSAGISVSKAASGYRLTVSTIRSSNGYTLDLTKADGTTLAGVGEGTYEDIAVIAALNSDDSNKYIYAGGSEISLPYCLTGDTAVSVDTSCLTGDMLVTVTGGAEKPISELTREDTYIAYDLTSGRLVEGVAAGYFDAAGGHSGKFADRYQKYTFSDGTVIKEVRRHRFLNLSRMEFINLCHWEIGDRIYKLDGTTPALVSKEDVVGEVEHFTVTTAGYHNGFVQGCLYGDRHTQRYKIVMADGRPVYDMSEPHTADYLYGAAHEN